MPSLTTLQCPHCGRRFDFAPVTSLTPEDLHEEELLRGTLNCTTCPGCTKVLNVPLRLVYRDSRRPFLLVQEPKPLPEAQAKALALKLDESATEAARAQGVQRPETRLVFTRQDFLEKLYLQRRGLDDRVVEFAKYQLFQGGAGQEAHLSPSRHRLLFDFSHREGDCLAFFLYDRGSGRPIRMLQVPKGEFDALEEEIRLNPTLQRELDRCFPGCRVDVDLLFQTLAQEKP